jgi:hypothetical protein
MEQFNILSPEVSERFNVKVEYLILKCQNPDCPVPGGWHWGKTFFSHYNEDGEKIQYLTEDDLICKKCKKAGLA